MKLIIGATLLLALMTLQPAMAQSTNPTAIQAATLRKARLKIWTGIALVATGAALVPITAVRHGASSENVAISSMALIGGAPAFCTGGASNSARARSLSLRSG
jgi:hypothetical protein